MGNISDEMNMHVPQDPASKAEIEHLCMVSKNLISPKNSNPIIGVVQDALLASYLVTQNDVFIDRELLMNLMMQIAHEFNGNIPEPTILLPKRLWTGKQVFSMILPNINLYKYLNRDSHNEMRELMSKRRKTKVDKEKLFELFASNHTDDTYFCIKRGQMLSGRLNKKILGLSGGSIVHVIHNDHGTERASHFLNHIQKILNFWLLHTGFSIGIGDTILEGYMTDHLDENGNRVLIKDYIQKNILQKAITDVNEIQKQSKNLSHDQLEVKINKALNKARTVAGRIVKDNIKKSNNIIIMVRGGSKGNELNLSQIIACLGQQNVLGKRIKFEYKNRTLPHFAHFDHGLQSCGFVLNSYLQGLKPHEFFFHTKAGREGLVDTAIRTADTGYTSRRLMKAMEDLKVCYDSTVRNSVGDIIQFLYGEDNIDPCSIESQVIDHFYLDKSDPNDMEILKQKYFIENCSGPVLEEWKMLLNDNDFVHDKFDSNRINLPVNLKRMIQNYQCNNSINSQQPIDKSLKPEFIVQKIRELENQLVMTLSGGNQVKERFVNGLALFFLNLRDKLAAKRVIYEFKLTKSIFIEMCAEIYHSYINACAQPGEMVGSIASQSLGEPTQQMTLNSVDWKEKTVVFKGGQNVFIGHIGEFVDKLLDQYTDKIQHFPNEQEYLEIKHLKYMVPTVDVNGKMSWKLLEAVTRHLPGIPESPDKKLVKVYTQCGRTAIATKGKSFLVRKTNEIRAIRGDELKVGDYIPIVQKYPLLENDDYLTELNMEEYFPKNTYIWGTEMLKAKSWKSKFKPNAHWFKKGVSEKRFIVPHGRSDTLSVSLDNRIFKNGVIYTRAGKIVPAEFPDTFKLDWLSGFFFGAYLAEGNATNVFQVGISNNDPDYLAQIKKFCARYKFGHNTTIDTNVRFEGSTSTTLHIFSRFLRDFVFRCCGNLSHKKFIPTWAVVANKEFVKGLLDAYFSGDGCMETGKNTAITSSSASKQLTIGIGHLLTRFGILCNFSKYQQTKNNIGSEDIKKAYRLRISNGDVKIFHKHIGFVIKTKNDRLTHIYENKEFTHINSKSDIIPGIVLGELKGDFHRKKVQQFYDNLISKEEKVSPEILSNLNNALNMDVLFSKITKIKTVDSTHKKVYDFTVADTRNFILFSGGALNDTFHFSGISSKNVTLGVPRIKEIINVAKNPKTPSLRVYLRDEYKSNKEKILELKSNLEYTTLNDVLKDPRQPSIFFDPNVKDSKFPQDDYFTNLYYQIMLSKEEIEKLSPWMIRFELDRISLYKRGITITSIVNHLKTHLKKDVFLCNSDMNAPNLIVCLRIFNWNSDDDPIDRTECYKRMEDLHEKLQDTLLCGIPEMSIKDGPKLKITKIFVEQLQEDDDNVEYYIDTEGSNLREMMNFPEIDFKRTMCNNPVEIYHVLGVEAARNAIINEIRDVLNFYSLNVNYRHLSLLADIMTYRGYIMSITRHGINRSDRSPLTKCTFEETVKFLINAARNSEKDPLTSVSPNIMLGRLAPMGTGTFDLVYDVDLNAVDDDGEIEMDIDDYYGHYGEYEFDESNPVQPELPQIEPEKIVTKSKQLSAKMMTSDDVLESNKNNPQNNGGGLWGFM